MSRTITIGDYVVTSRLGNGSFATVYKGHHRVSGQVVAIKAIALGRMDKKAQENLESEISIMREVRHTNIVRLFEIQKSEKFIYLVLEYCSGGDLSRLIDKEGPFPEKRAKFFMQQLSAGLKFLWDRNLIHRDLKPQNLLLTTQDGETVLKIADFGFARHLATASLAETLCGSPLYMAPEILRYQRYDAKADLWSVGAILYEMLCKRTPFTGRNHIELLRNIERQELRLPETITISKECLELLKLLLRRNPVQRASFEIFFASPFVQPGQRPSLLTIKTPPRRSPAGAGGAPPSTAPGEQSPSVPPSNLEVFGVHKSQTIKPKKDGPTVPVLPRQRRRTMSLDLPSSARTPDDATSEAMASVHALPAPPSVSSIRRSASANSLADAAGSPTALFRRVSSEKSIAQSKARGGVSVARSKDDSHVTKPTSFSTMASHRSRTRSPLAEVTEGGSDDSFVLVANPGKPVFEPPAAAERIPPAEMSASTASRARVELSQKLCEVLSLGDEARAVAELARKVSGLSIGAQNPSVGLKDDLGFVRGLASDRFLGDDRAQQQAIDAAQCEALALYVQALQTQRVAVGTCDEAAKVRYKDTSGRTLPAAAEPEDLQKLRKQLQEAGVWLRACFQQCLRYAEVCVEQVPVSAKPVCVEEVVYRHALRMGRSAASREMMIASNTIVPSAADAPNSVFGSPPHCGEYIHACLLLRGLARSTRLSDDDMANIASFYRRFDERRRVVKLTSSSGTLAAAVSVR